MQEKSVIFILSGHILNIDIDETGGGIIEGKRNIFYISR